MHCNVAYFNLVAFVNILSKQTSQYVKSILRLSYKLILNVPGQNKWIKMSRFFAGSDSDSDSSSEEEQIQRPAGPTIFTVSMVITVVIWDHTDPL